MLRFKKRIPNYVDAPKPEIQEFDSVESMLQDKWITLFKDEEGFYRFSQSDDYLMAEYEDGERWRLVGRVEGDITSLPMWRSGN